MDIKPALRIALTGMLVWTLTQLTYAQSCGEVHRLCGPTSLLALCQSLDVKTDLEELKRLSGFDERNGTTMSGLRTAAESKGLHAVGMKIAVDEMIASRFLAIAYLWGNHFVAIECDGSESIKVAGLSGKPTVVSKKELSTLYSGFALVVAKDENLFPQAGAKGPDLRCDAYTYDFGFIEQGEQAGQRFNIENKGIEDLVLSKVETSCSCTQAFLPKEQRIPPGGKGELVVGYDSTGREGGQSQIVYVYSNDPISPVVQLQINGVIKPVRLPVSVRSLDFGTVKKRDGATREFSIKDPGDDSLTVQKVTSDTRSVKVSLTRNADKQGTTYLVKAVLSPGAPIGILKGAIKVSSNHPKEPVVEIPVAADVVGDIDIFPHQFFLGLLKRGESASKKLTLSTTSDEPLTIQNIENPCDYVIVTAAPEVKGNKYTITATLKGAAPVGLIKQVVVIHTTDPDQPEIKIPLFALIQD